MFTFDKLNSKVKKNNGFTLLETIFALTITALLVSSFLQMVSLIYKDHHLSDKRLGQEMDAHLVVDYIYEKIKMAEVIEIKNNKTLELFTYLDGEKRWLKFCPYKNNNIKKLGQRKGTALKNTKGYSRTESMLDNIEEIRFEKLKNNNLILIELRYINKNREEIYKKIAAGI